MSLIIKIKRTFVFIFFLSTSINAQKYYFPERGEVWKEKTPSTFNIDESKLKSAIDFAKQNEYSGSTDMRVAVMEAFASEPFHEVLGPTEDRGGSAGIILKNGYLIAKWGDVKKVDMTHSATKSYLSTIAGLAVDEKFIASPNDIVKNYVWDGSFASTHNSKITWDHLLTQSSDWSGDLWEQQDWADRPPKEGGIDDWKNRILKEPGTNFEYNDVRVNLLAYSLLQVWRKPLPAVLKEKIMDPIGASQTWRWYGYKNSWTTIDGIKVQSVSGGGHSGGGIFINTEDHARFGLLFLNNGKWKDKQFISENWINKAITSSKANVNYGYMWWLNKKGSRHWEGVPESVYYAAGFGGNMVIIDKEHDLVIVTRWLENAGEFVKKVMEAL